MGDGSWQEKKREVVKKAGRVNGIENRDGREMRGCECDHDEKTVDEGREGS